MTATSSTLTADRTTLTGSDGFYRLGGLPPGPYVLTFTRTDLVTVKHQFRLSPTKLRILDVTVLPVRDSEGTIVVNVDRERAIERPDRSRGFTSEGLGLFPVTGGTLSAARWGPGQISVRPFEGLVLVDGAPMRSAWRMGAPPALLDAHEVPAAITTTIGHVPSEYGRLRTGVLAASLRSGGNRLTGAVRSAFGTAGLDADRLDASALDGVASGAEYRLGGPIRENRTWFFVAGRHFRQRSSERTAIGSQAYSSPQRQRLVTGKVTHAWNGNQRLEAMLSVERQRLDRAGAIEAVIGGREVVEHQTLAAWLGSASYDVQLGDRLWMTARFTGERGSREVEADLSGGRTELSTLQDLQSGATWWSPAACGDCTGEVRTGSTWRVAGSYLAAAGDQVHDLVFGYEGSRDGHQWMETPAGGLFEVRASGLLETPAGLAPVARPNGSTWIVWHPGGDADQRFTSHAWFAGDEWRYSPNLTVSLGMRWDRFAMGLEGNEPLLTESGFSPRVAVTWQPRHAGDWTVTAAFARYLDRTGARDGVTPALTTSRAVRAYVYEGPALNTAPGGQPLGSADAVEQILSWFDAAGGTARTPWMAHAPHLITTTAGVGRPVSTTEWTFGIGRRLGRRTDVRADVFWQDVEGGSGRRVDPASAPVADPFGQAVDTAAIIADSELVRKYVGLSVRAVGQFGVIGLVGGHYTLSRARGNFDPVWPANDPLRIAVSAYPEYVRPEWTAPTGALTDDARHRLRIWGLANVMASETLGSLSVSMVSRIDSGQPYGAVGFVEVASFVDNPGYALPPVAAPYFFTPRDAFRTSGAARTDVAVNYTRIVPGTVRGELFVRLDLLNLFGQQRERPLLPHRAVRTAFSDPDRFAPFNPFTEAPEQGVHWAVDPRLGPETDTGPQTLSRVARLILGVRF